MRPARAFAPSETEAAGARFAAQTQTEKRLPQRTGAVPVAREPFQQMQFTFLRPVRTRVVSTVFGNLLGNLLELLVSRRYGRRRERSPRRSGPGLRHIHTDNALRFTDSRNQRGEVVLHTQEPGAIVVDSIVAQMGDQVANELAGAIELLGLQFQIDVHERCSRWFLRCFFRWKRGKCRARLANGGYGIKLVIRVFAMSVDKS